MTFVEPHIRAAASDSSATRSAAQKEWAQLTLRQRLAVMKRVRHAIAENPTRLAERSAQARTRPLAEILAAEVLPLANAARFLEKKASGILKPYRVSGGMVYREPFGTVLIIGPGNYPLFLPGVQMLQALVAGNAVVLKPGVNGRGAAEALRDLFISAGGDSRLLTILGESAEEAQSAIEQRPDKVVFTGSARIGRAVLRQLSKHGIPAVMELSGSDPVIVCADADLGLTVRALVFGLHWNGSATCIAPRRVYVHQSIATELEGRLAQALAAAKSDSVRMPASPGCDRLRELVEDAVAHGAHLISGEIRKDGSIVGPVILAGLSPDARILREEIFAPVLSLVTVDSGRRALEYANRSDFALGGSIFSRSYTEAGRLATELAAGLISINDLIVPSARPDVPFSGTRASGFGVTRGAEGLLEMTRLKVVTVTHSKFRPAFAPLSPQDGALFDFYIKLAHGRAVAERIAALVNLFRSLIKRKRT